MTPLHKVKLLNTDWRCVHSVINFAYKHPKWTHNLVVPIKGEGPKCDNYREIPLTALMKDHDNMVLVVAMSRREAVLHLLLAAGCIPPASAGKNNKLCLHPHHNECPRAALQKTRPLTGVSSCDYNMRRYLKQHVQY